MLIDFITAYLPFDHIHPDDWQKLRLLTERVMRFKPNTPLDLWAFTNQDTGETLHSGYFLLDVDSIVYETAAWESLRSDSHQIAFRVGSDAIWFQGSPARVCGSGDAVFGEGAAGALDITGSVLRMIAFVESLVNVKFTKDVTKWHVSRIDITGNLFLDSLASVRIALRTLRDCEGGRYRVSQQAGDTVYWSHKSRLRSGKAYAKGPHIDYQLKNPKYTGRQYTESELQIISRLLRLELKLGSQWIRERLGKPWHQLSSGDLTQEWKNYFFRMIGDSSMQTNDDVQQRIIDVAPTPGRGKSAYALFLLIQAKGWEQARELTPKTSWYRSLGLMRDAGLADADISAGNVVQLRRKVIETQLVHNWHDALLAA